MAVFSHLPSTARIPGEQARRRAPHLHRRRRLTAHSGRNHDGSPPAPFARDRVILGRLGTHERVNDHGCCCWTVPLFRRCRSTRRLRVYRNGDLRFDVRDEGPLDGPVVVLLHGFPEGASAWNAVASRLHRAGLRTVAPDQRGYSPGARPRTRASYRISYLVDDVVTLVQEIGIPVHLVGHDWGAAVAWRTAATRPALVRTLTTISVPHPAAFARSLLASSQLLRSWYVLAFQPPLVVEAGVRLCSRTHDGTLAGQRPRRRGGPTVRGGVPRWRCTAGCPRLVPRHPARRVCVHAPVRVPTTHVWSEEEVALSKQGARLSGRYVDAPYELVSLSGVNHWAPTQAPDAVAAAILDRVGGDAGVR